MWYLCFLANNLAMEIFSANDTIAMPTQSPIIMGNTRSGGIVGFGILRQPSKKFKHANLIFDYSCYLFKNAPQRQISHRSDLVRVVELAKIGNNCAQDDK
jgi:hypothetical protein